ncbi:MAG: ATP-binding cassette domain-containing protein [Lachnospiraceae bacterium]
MRKLSSRITGAFNEGITGAKTSKTLVIEDSNDSEFRSLTGQARDAGVKAAKLSAVYIPLVLFCSTLAVAIVLYSGGHMSLDGVLGLSTLSAFVTYAVGIFEPVQILAEDLAEFISLQANIERVTGLLDTEPNVRDSQAVIEKYGDAFHPKRENWEPIRGDIEFRDVTFRYPDGGEDVLSHFDLKIPAGTTVAIVGETGAGKSTLVNLACRFFEPTEGQILMRRCGLPRAQSALAPLGHRLRSAEPAPLSGSLRENIRYGRLDATDEEVEAAARAVSRRHRGRKARKRLGQRRR